MEPAREQNERRGNDEPLYKVFIGTGITYGPFVGPKYQETFDIDGDTTRMTVEHEKCITAEKGKAPRFVRSSSTLSGEKLVEFIKGIESLEQVSMPKKRVDTDLLGADTSIVVIKDGSRVWGYGLGMDMSSESQIQGCCTDYDDEQKVEHNEGNDELFTSAEKTLYKEISGRLLKLLQE